MQRWRRVLSIAISHSGLWNLHVQWQSTFEHQTPETNRGSLLPLVASLAASPATVGNRREGKINLSLMIQWIFCTGLAYLKMDQCMGQRCAEAPVQFVKKQKLRGVVQSLKKTFLPYQAYNLKLA